MRMITALVLWAALPSLPITEPVGPQPVAVTVRAEPTEAMADRIELVVDVTNTSTEPVYWVWYDFRSADVHSADARIAYVEDLDRDPSVATCGGYLFNVPQFIEVTPNQTARRKVFVWLRLPTPSLPDLAASTLAELSRLPRLVPGRWRVEATFAVIRKAALAPDLVGSGACEHLRRHESLVSASAELLVSDEARKAWTKRREEIEAIFQEWRFEGRYFFRYARFFEVVSGIRLTSEVAVEERPRDERVFRDVLLQWDTWFISHGACIAWAPELGRYVTGPGCEGVKGVRQPLKSGGSKCE